jgi:glycosyltransferase involved in cell wall biosynthesis
LPVDGLLERCEGPLDVLDQVTPLIITHNEAPNIRRTIGKLLWAKKIVVIDSGSQDETLEILKSYNQVDVLHRPFTDFASQCNFGLTQVTTTWVLSLDADYELSDELVAELGSLNAADEIGGFRANFVYRIYGRSLRGSLYPPRIVLYRRKDAAYLNEGHSHRVSVKGVIRSLSAPIFHDDRKTLSHWFGSQQRYAREEARYLLSSERSELSRIDRLRISGVLAPVAVVIYVLFVKGCLLDGLAGWFYLLQRCLAETMLALEILDHRLRNRL